MCVAIIIDDKKEDSDKKKASSTSSSSNGGAATTTTTSGAVTVKKEKKIAKAEEEPLGENVFGIEEDESDSKVAGAQKTKLCVCMYVCMYIVSLSQSKLVVMMQLIVRLKRRLFEEIEPSSKHVVASH